MKETINQFEQLLASGMEYITHASEAVLREKINPKKWSKKEILGHLIDSGINNLQRFTQIQFDNKPYKIIPYKQEELVKANNYQAAETSEIAVLWLALNTRILMLMKNQTETTLAYKVELYENEFSDLRFLMTDYVEHLEHHLNQIIEKQIV